MVPLPTGFAGREDEDPPLLTVRRVVNRIEIAAVSSEARALGLQPGMALAQARAMVPGLDVRDSEPEADSALLRRLALFAARHWTPRAAVSGADGLWLDLAGVAHLFGGEKNMARRILGLVARAGFTARIAVAATPGAAHALARFGSEPLILCPSGGEAAALASLPLAALRVEEDVVAAARRLGLERIGDLLALPRAPLQRRFGKTLLLRLDQALGRAAEPFEPIVPADPLEMALRLAEPISTAEAIGQVVRDLLAELVVALAEKSLGIRLLALLCERVDGEAQRLLLGTARPTRDPDHLRKLIEAKIETIEPGFGIEAMRLIASRVEPLGPLTIEGALAGSKPTPDLAPLVDRLATRLGTRRLFRLGAVESDIPERSVRRVGPLDRVAGWPGWPRPVRLLAPPEPVEQVMALLPDGAPMRFNWRGRAYRIAAADGPERLYGEWWKRLDEADLVRDYFQVEDMEGRRFWLFRKGDARDPSAGHRDWYLHGVFG